MPGTTYERSSFHRFRATEVAGVNFHGVNMAIVGPA
jgi:hypothetical protein